MQAGRLDRRITLQRPVTTTDEDGSEIPGWEDVGKVWATVTPVSARERHSSPKVIPEQAATIYIRWRSDVHPSWRILHEGQPWRITGIAEMERREGLQISAERVETQP